MKINYNYSLDQIESTGLIEKFVKDLKASIFTKDQKVYFFEKTNRETYRLYSVIINLEISPLLLTLTTVKLPWLINYWSSQIHLMSALSQQIE
jgi:hypothetical protein